MLPKGMSLFLFFIHASTAGVPNEIMTEAKNSSKCSVMFLHNSDFEKILKVVFHYLSKSQQGYAGFNIKACIKKRAPGILFLIFAS